MMENRDNFCIRAVQDSFCEASCPACGGSFTTRFLAVHDDHGQPICELCAWEKAMTLASLLYLAHVAGAYCGGEAPTHVIDGLEQRRTDPKRLKRKLKEAHKSLHDNGMGPLANLVAGQIKAALDSGKVETMRQAEQLLSETRSRVPNLDDEIPF